MTPPPASGASRMQIGATYNNLGQVYFTFLPQAFQFGQGKKQAGASGLANLSFLTLSLNRKFYAAGNRCEALD